MARLVRPWKPCSKQRIACRPVKYRATFTAFSTASAPLFTKKVRFSWVPGRDPVEPLGQLDVGLVGGDREADVGEPVELGRAPPRPRRDAGGRC